MHVGVGKMYRRKIYDLLILILNKDVIKTMDFTNIVLEDLSWFDNKRINK